MKQETGSLKCKLTSSELRERKRTVLAAIREKILIRNELDGGFEYQFPGSDEIIDQLTQFIKNERLCCDFLDYQLSIAGDRAGGVRLAISGPAGSKDFIRDELEL